MNKKQEIKNILNQFTPDQQAFAQHSAEVQLQNKLMTQQLIDLKKAYDEVYRVLIVLLHVDPDHELRMHDSHFLRFKDEYRIDTSYDKDMHEVVWKLRALGEIDYDE